MTSKQVKTVYTQEHMEQTHVTPWEGTMVFKGRARTGHLALWAEEGIRGPWDWGCWLPHPPSASLSSNSPNASLVAQRVKHLPTMRETRVWSQGREDPLEKEMAPHSSTLAWKIPWSEKPGRLQSMGWQRVGHDWATSLHFRGLYRAILIWAVYSKVGVYKLIPSSTSFHIFFSLNMSNLLILFFYLALMGLKFTIISRLKMC